MWSSDLLHFTLYYMLFVPQTSNLFLNISYSSVFLKMCYIMWLWCHRNVTHMIKLYHIRMDGGGGGVKQLLKKKTNIMSKFPIRPPPCRCCYDSFTYFSPLIFLIYSLHAPTSCLLFLVYILISFYRLSFLSCAALLFMCSLMHSTITHAQSCTDCLLMHSLLRHSLVTQYIRTG